MLRRITWLATVALIALGASACTAGVGAEQQQTEARPLPESAQDLRPGEYRTEAFEPALSFTVGKGWALECPEGPDFVCLLPPGEQTRLRFVNVDKVYEPSGLMDMSGKTTPPPADLVGFFERHPYLETDKPKQVRVGGIEGEQLDVAVGELPKGYPEGLCGYDCVQLSSFSDGDDWAIEEGNKNRLTILKDVKGEKVIIDFTSPAARFDESWPKAEKVLETVEWKGT
jgi:hypothetical protein